jgi:hypothetical protein
LPPPDVEAPLPLLPDKSDNSDFENDTAPSTKTLLSLSSLSAVSPPHTLPRSTTGTPVPSALRLAQCQAAPRLPMLPAPDLLRCSGCQIAGVPPNPNYTATQYLQQGRPEPHRVATYKESLSSSRPVARQLALNGSSRSSATPTALLSVTRCVSPPRASLSVRVSISTRPLLLPPNGPLCASSLLLQELESIDIYLRRRLHLHLGKRWCASHLPCLCGQHHLCDKIRLSERSRQPAEVR